MKRYKALTKQGAPILSVIADDEAEARRRIREQLDRPGRRQLLRQWEAGGERIRAEEVPV